MMNLLLICIMVTLFISCYFIEKKIDIFINKNPIHLEEDSLLSSIYIACEPPEDENTGNSENEDSKLI